MESLPHMEGFDIHLIGYSDVVTQALVHKLGWKFPQDALVQQNPETNLDYQAGSSPWKWMFAGAMEQPHQHSEESSEEEASDMTPDTPLTENRSEPDEDGPQDANVIETVIEHSVELGTDLELVIGTQHQHLQ
jgi:hypothetical protein